MPWCSASVFEASILFKYGLALVPSAAARVLFETVPLTVIGAATAPWRRAKAASMEYESVDMFSGVPAGLHNYNRMREQGRNERGGLGRVMESN